MDELVPEILKLLSLPQQVPIRRTGIPAEPSSNIARRGRERISETLAS